MKQKQKLFARDNYELRTCTELVLSFDYAQLPRSRSAASRREVLRTCTELVLSVAVPLRGSKLRGSVSEGEGRSRWRGH
ncbi:MAG: hypothetical protein V7K77_13105 [Nostoc sp.]|uniref:hypothetical protein n=1 Tax=Nostoc sp. TaxID=1180 RepID=UPI002FFB41DE